MNLVGIILAGGQSRRMGTDKAFLKRQGKTQLSHCYQLLHALNCQSVLLSHPQLGIEDRFVGQGPLAGLEACIRYFLNQGNEHAQAIVIPIDMPFLTETDLKVLIKYTQVTLQPAYFFENFLPFSLYINQLIADQITQLLIGKKRSVQHCLNALAGMSYPPQSKARLLNTNTPESWQQCL